MNFAMDALAEQIWKSLENACVLKNDRICENYTSLKYYIHYLPLSTSTFCFNYSLHSRGYIQNEPLKLLLRYLSPYLLDDLYHFFFVLWLAMVF